MWIVFTVLGVVVVLGITALVCADILAHIYGEEE